LNAGLVLPNPGLGLACGHFRQVAFCAAGERYESEPYGDADGCQNDGCGNDGDGCGIHGNFLSPPINLLLDNLVLLAVTPHY
jgi:hypothetical protein